MVEEEVEFVPALYKIFDEILVNAADNKQRDSSMKLISIVIDMERGWIRIKNDGKGIPVEMHSEHNMFVPELIFGNLLTSSNYNDADLKTVGGRNGFGAKLANIFSTRFIVETVDSENDKKYVQEWRDNMSSKGDPVIEAPKSRARDYTQITFYPDLISSDSEWSRYKMRIR
jgi:DNA topoisomerase-2